MNAYIVLLLRGGRIGSVPIALRAEAAELFHWSLEQRNADGTEYWNVYGLTAKGRKHATKEVV